MGQKVNPHGLRVGVIKDWDSKWFAGKKEFGDQLVEDHQIRKFITKTCFNAGIANELFPLLLFIGIGAIFVKGILCSEGRFGWFGGLDSGFNERNFQSDMLQYFG